MKREKVITAGLSLMGGVFAIGLLFAFHSAIARLPQASPVAASPVEAPSAPTNTSGTKGPLSPSTGHRLLEVAISFAGDTGPVLKARWTPTECAPVIRDRTESRRIVSEAAFTYGPVFVCLDPSTQKVSSGELLWRATQKGGAPARGALLLAAPSTGGALHGFVGVASICSDSTPQCAFTVAEGQVKNPRWLSIGLLGEKGLLTYQRERGALDDELESIPDEEEEIVSEDNILEESSEKE